MKNFASANKYLSTAFALAALVAAGAVPASAQSRDHTGSMMPFYYDETGGQKTGAWSKEEEGAEPPTSRRRCPRGRSICMRANARLITAPGCTETPGRFGIRSQRQRSSCPYRGRGRDRLAWSRPPLSPIETTAVSFSVSCSLSLGVIGPHPHLSPRRHRAAVAGPSGLSRDSSTRRRENVEQDNNRARRRNRSRHRRHGIGRDRASAPCQSGDLSYGGHHRHRQYGWHHHHRLLPAVRWPLLQHRLSAVRSSLQARIRHLVTSAVGWGGAFAKRILSDDDRAIVIVRAGGRSSNPRRFGVSSSRIRGRGDYWMLRLRGA